MEQGASDLHFVAVVERHGAHALAVHLRAVRGLEILEAVGVAVRVVEDDRVLAADALVEQRDVRGRVASDQGLGRGEIEGHALEAAVLDHEAGGVAQLGHALPIGARFRSLEPGAGKPYRRRWRSAGRLARTRSCCARSQSAHTTAGRSGATASSTPHGSTISARPWLARSAECCPHCAGAITKHWFSIARARSSTSQWSRPVSRANALGTSRKRAPRALCAR